MASVILDAGHGGYDNGATYNGRTEKEDNLNLTLAVGNILQNNGIDVMYTRTDDVYQSPNLAVLCGTNIPAVLIEAGFINTDQDNQIFDLKFPEVAQAIADGILQSIQEAEAVSSAQVESGTYLVETGIFRHVKNAEHVARCMQEDGFDCFIEEKHPYFSVCRGYYETLEMAQEEEQKLSEMGYETRIVQQ